MMAENWLKLIYEWVFRIITVKRFVYMVLIFAILLLVIPDSIQQYFSAKAPVFNVGLVVFYLVLFAISYVLCDLYQWIKSKYKKYNEKITKNKAKESLEKLINNLSEKELNILYDAVIDGKMIFKFHNRSPSALRLVEKNILKYHGTIKDKPIMGWFEINRKYYQIILKKYANKLNNC